MKRQKYLNNKDMLREIHKSKMTYCSMIDKKYNQHDVIICEHEDDLSPDGEVIYTSASITDPKVTQEALENKAIRLRNENYEKSYKEWTDNGCKGEKPKQSMFTVDPSDLDPSELVYRVMTFQHIPEDRKKKRKARKVSDLYTRCNFPPFKHFIIVNGTTKEVLRSHWEGDMISGNFSTTHGKTTDGLARIYLKLCERYSMKSNWRGYSYVDEMRDNAILQLSQVGLQFNEFKGQNPFAYFTATLSNSFTRVLNLERKNQDIRDNLLQEAGQMPSFNRQLEHEERERSRWDERIDQERREASGTNF